MIRPGQGADDRARVHAAAQAMEALFLKQMVKASHAFSGGESAGSTIREDLFADTLADALEKGGGIGLARQLEATVASVRDPTLPPAAAAPTLPAPVEATRDPASAAAPLRALTVTSGFGPRADPIDGHLTRHAGVDLRGAEGEPIRAAAGGVVRRAGALGGYGEAVEVDHGNGLTTLYAHASELLVREGDRVAAGQAIARVGHTGRVTGTHLHFEVRQDGKPVDPGLILGHATGPPDTAQDLLGALGTVAPAAAGVGSSVSPSRALKIYARRVDEASESGS